MKKITIFILFLIISMVINAQSISEYNYNVNYGNPTSYDNPGTIIYPVGYANYSSKTPVIFVHGITGKLSGSYQANIDQVKNYHLKAAFVQLKPIGSTIENGKLLKKMIDRVRSHFNAATVSIVAHSKGGMDAERALYGQNPYVSYSLPSFGYEKVDGVYTFSSPVQGARVADLGETLSYFSGLVWATMWYTNGWSLTSGNVNSFHNWAKGWRINSTSTFGNYYNSNGASYSRLNLVEDNTTRWWAHQSDDECYQDLWYYCYIGRPFHHTVGAYLDAYWEWDWFDSGWRNWHSNSDGFISEYRAKRNINGNAYPSLTPGAGDSNYRTMRDANHSSLWEEGENHFSREVAPFLHNGLYYSTYKGNQNPKEVLNSEQKEQVKAPKSSIMASSGNIYFGKNGVSELIVEEDNNDMEILMYSQNKIRDIVISNKKNTFKIKSLNSVKDKFSGAMVSVFNFDNLKKGVYKLQAEENSFLVMANNKKSNTAFAVNLNFDEEQGYDGQKIQVGIANKEDKIDFENVVVKGYLAKIGDSYDSYIKPDKVKKMNFTFKSSSKKGIYELDFKNLSPGSIYSLRIEALSKTGEVLLSRNIVNTFFVSKKIDVKNVVAVNDSKEEKSNIDLPEFQLNVYPNPTTDKVMVEVMDNEILQVQILNNSGNIVEELKINDNNALIDIKELHLKSGLYFLNIKTTKGNRLQKIMVE